MAKNNGGNGGIILNVASLAAFKVFYPLPVYTATKWGVVGFVRSIGHEYYHNNSGVNVMAICPGFTQTNLISELKKETLEKIRLFTIGEKAQR